MNTPKIATKTARSRYATRIAHYDRETKGFKLPVTVNHRSRREAISAFNLAASLIRGSQSKRSLVEGNNAGVNWYMARVELLSPKGKTIQMLSLTRSERNKAQIRLSALLHPNDKVVAVPANA